MDSEPMSIIRRRDRPDPIDDRKLRIAIASGEWVRIAPGVFARGSDWQAASPRERHRTRVLETMRRVRAPYAASHHAAAALLVIDVLGEWPGLIDLSCPPASGGRSRGTIRRHPRLMTALDLTVVEGFFVTSAAQTALDLARILPFAQGVAVMDQVLWDKRPGGPLSSVDEILRVMSIAPHRGDARARRAIEFADPGAANVRESQSRVLIAQLGFPAPRVQERRVLAGGRLVFGDFYWPDHDHWGELDGEGKYLSPEFGPLRDPRQIVLDEKRRENEIRREVRGFSRWEPADLDRPRRLYDILTRDGLPSSLPRP